MDCERFDSVSLELLYDELDELSAAATRRHLHICSRCQNSWNKLRATRDLTDIPLEEPPDDLFNNVMNAERDVRGALSFKEKVSRSVSVLAGYAMRPQLAMAALLLLMIGSSLVFVRTQPEESDKVSVTELGAPFSESTGDDEASQQTLVVDAEASSQQDEEDAARGREPTISRDYSDAMEAYQAGRYAEAERLFSEVAAAGGEKAAAAALHEGHSARNGSGCQRAAPLYDAVATRHAGSTVAKEAAWHAASCYRAMGQLARARTHYERLVESPAYAERAEAALASMQDQADTQVSTAAAVPAAAKTNASAERAVNAEAATGDAKAKPQQMTGAKPVPEKPSTEEVEDRTDSLEPPAEAPAK